MLKHAKIELIKQVKQEVTILFSEKGSADIDMMNIVQISNKYGRMIGMGQEGKKFKLVLHIKGIESHKWLSVALELIKSVSESRSVKEKNHVS